jgi:L-ascorbate metabolism protein UlaG (beta-lactamase superfamily)
MTVSLQFIGTATTLIRYGGIVLLTDPNFLHKGERAYVGKGLTAKRLTEPALPITGLPPLDGVVLSHLHGDHWDRVARRGLDRDLPILTTPHASKRLQLQRFPRALGLRTWSSHVIAKADRFVRVTALPGRHAPGILQRLLPPVMGSLLEFGRHPDEVELTMYISGDTLMFDGVHEIASRYRGIDVGVVHLGGTVILRSMVVTMDGVQGADWVEVVNPKRVVPVHYDDYDRFKSPLWDFTAEVARRGLQGKLVELKRGGTATFARGQEPVVE